MTIICRSKKFIFVHLVKCGGTSVERTFAPHARWNDLIVGSTTWGERLQPLHQRLFGLTKHSPAKKIVGAVGRDVWSDFWTVALVRHPLRIYESLYSWIGEIVEGISSGIVSIASGFSLSTPATDCRSRSRSGRSRRPMPRRHASPSSSTWRSSAGC